jgi:hypothetical protein
MSNLPKNIQALLDKYELVFDEEKPKESDVFISPNYKIISRSGIEKIQAIEGVNITYEVIVKDSHEVVLKGVFTKDGAKLETFGEASLDKKEFYTTYTKITAESTKGTPYVKEESVVNEFLVKKGNVKQSPSYLFAMAEKRCKSRGVLMMVGLYKEGFFGEDEADDFSSFVREQKRQTINTPSVEVKKIK